MQTIPYIVYESTTARLERTIKRLWILCLLLVAICLVSNVCWICYESKYQVVETSITQDLDATTENSNINIKAIGGDYYGN